MDDFIAAQQEGRWASELTCHSARWQITRFLDYLEQCSVTLAAVTPAHIDAFFEHMAQCGRGGSLRTSAKMLRAWFGFCGQRGWTRAGLADVILSPRVYRQEGLPLGPTWDAVGRVLAETSAEDPTSLRDHAIILMLSVYGLRSGTVRRLRLDDIDWAHDRIRFIRSKSRREETAPLEPRVGNAIARYSRQGRPNSDTRIVFLTLRRAVPALVRGWTLQRRQEPARQTGVAEERMRAARPAARLRPGTSWSQAGVLRRWATISGIEAPTRLAFTPRLT